MKTFKQFLKESEEKELDEAVTKSDITSVLYWINLTNDSFHKFEDNINETLNGFDILANNNNIDVKKEIKNIEDILDKIKRLREKDLNISLKKLTDKIQGVK